MDPAEALRLAADAPVARLATVRPDGHPHLVPIVFAIVGETLVTAVDAKPKRTRSLRRLDNVRAEPRVTVLVDHYADDWSRLWWVRMDGSAIVTDGLEPAHRRALVEKYPQYRDHPPDGPAVVVAIERVASWAP